MEVLISSLLKTRRRQIAASAIAGFSGFSSLQSDKFKTPFYGCTSKCVARI